MRKHIVRFVIVCALSPLIGCTDEVTGAGGRAPVPVPASEVGNRLDAFAPPFHPAGPGEGRYLRRDARGVAELTREGMSLSLRGAEKTIRWGLVGARAVE